MTYIIGGDDLAALEAGMRMGDYILTYNCWLSLYLCIHCKARFLMA
jgi:hypothetical protein